MIETNAEVGEPATGWQGGEAATPWQGDERAARSQVAARRRSAAQHGASFALAESATLAEALPRVLGALVAGLGWDVGEVWLPVSGGRVLRCEAVWTVDDELSRYEAAVRSVSIEAGLGVVGRVFRTGFPETLSDLPGDSDLARKAASREARLHKGLAFPIHTGSTVLGVMTLASREEPEVDDSLMLMLDAVGSQVGLFVRSLGVAEQARAGAESRRLYQRIVETANEGVWTVNAAGRTTYVNGRMAEMLGVRVADMMGRPLCDFFPAEDAETARLALDRRRGGVEHLESRAEHKDASVVWLHLAVSPMTDADGAYEGALAMVTDITERKKLDARLMLADRLGSLGTMAAGVAHEINNPLAYLMTSISFVAEGVDAIVKRPASIAEQHEELRQALDDARDGADRIRRIVRDLKTFSRDDHEQKMEVSLPRLVDSAIAMASNEIRHRARLVRALDPTPTVDASESRIGQVVLNLLINAAQSIPEGSADKNEIRVVTRTDERGRAVIEVHDTGAGIPEDVRPRIFDPFFTTKPVGVGTGLGLSICHSIVTAVCGEIWCESTPGTGSTFFVALPPGKKAMSAPVPPGPQKGRRGRLMVIDDEPGICTAASRVLGTEHEVVTFARAREALAALAVDPAWDLILCDVMMPEMTGMDFQAALAAKLPELEPRVVFLTGGAFTERAREFLETVKDRRIEKPFDAASLRKLVRARL